MSSENPDFWVAVATAAPIIMLAQLVIAERVAHVFAQMRVRNKVYPEAVGAFLSSALSSGACLFIFVHALDALRRHAGGPTGQAEGLAIFAFAGLVLATAFTSIAEVRSSEDASAGTPQADSPRRGVGRDRHKT